MNPKIAATLIALSLAVTAPLNAQTATRTALDAQPPTYAEPLGIALETWPYPHPVAFLPLEIQGQQLRMAYMDSLPTVAPARPKTPVVLFHGKNFYGAYWENTINALNAAGYRVIVPDQIGFGKSSKPDINYSFDLLAANTAKLLDTLGVDKVNIVGHSMGGMVATRFALNYPNRVEKLVLENPIGLEDYHAATGPIADETLYQAELKATAIEPIRAYYKNYFVTWKSEYEKFLEVRARLILSGEFSRAAKASALTYQMVLQQPVVYQFPQIKVPTLLVIGQADRTVVGKNYMKPEVAAQMGDYPALGKRTAQAIPNARLVEMANIGHIPHLEAPTEFHRALIAFLQ